MITKHFFSRWVLRFVLMLVILVNLTIIVTGDIGEDISSALLFLATCSAIVLFVGIVTDEKMKKTDTYL